MDDGKSIYLMATLDTKGREALFLKGALETLGHSVKVIDVGILCDSPGWADIPRKAVIGRYEGQIAAVKTRNEASRYVIEGAGAIVSALYNGGKLEGLVSLGGSGGSGIASAVMHRLPLGVPKVIVTTMASGNTLPYVQGEDILLVNPVVDIQNLNFLTRYALRQAAAIVHGMLQVKMEAGAEKTIALTGFGVTTPCVDYCTELLEKKGYEVLVFHARGISGGQIMEKMVREGRFLAVVDITTSEVADELCGGIYGVKNRMCAAVEEGIPYVVAPGALEMVNLSTMDTLQGWQKERVLYAHSASSVKMRADASDMRRLADVFAERLGRGNGAVSVLIPERGFSSVNREGEVFYDPGADRVFVERLKEKMPAKVPVISMDAHINDRSFAEALVKELERRLGGEC